MKRKCISCGNQLFGRSDQRFCSDQCRTSHNNKLNSDQNNFMRNVNNILRKNRRILAELNPKDKAKVHKDRLMERGFKFSYFTNQYITKAGTTYYFCYEYGYIALDNNMYALVKRKEYVE